MLILMLILTDLDVDLDVDFNIELDGVLNVVLDVTFVTLGLILLSLIWSSGSISWCTVPSLNKSMKMKQNID